MMFIRFQGVFQNRAQKLFWGPKLQTDSCVFRFRAVLGIQEGAQNDPKVRPIPPGFLEAFQWRLEVVLGARGSVGVDCVVLGVDVGNMLVPF